MTDVQVMDCDSSGIRILSGAPTLTNVQVARARHDAFYGNLAADVTATNLSAVDTGGNRYALAGGHLTAGRTYAAPAGRPHEDA